MRGKASPFSSKTWTSPGSTLKPDRLAVTDPVKPAQRHGQSFARLQDAVNDRLGAEDLARLHARAQSAVARRQMLGPYADAEKASRLMGVRGDSGLDVGAALIERELQPPPLGPTGAAARMFICGAPRKQATKRLRGWE